MAPQAESEKTKPVGSLFANITKLTLSRGASMALGFVFTPIVARLYMPEQFGIYGLITSIATWVSALMAMGYYGALPLAHDRSEGRTTYKLCMLLIAAQVGALLLIFGPGGGSMAALFNEPQAATFMLFVPVLFLLDALATTTESGLSKEGKFGTISVVNFLNANTGRLATVVWALVFGSGVLGLLMGNVIGVALGAAISMTVLIKTLYRDEDPNPRRKVSMLEVMRKHSQFPKIQVWNYLLRASTSRLPVFILAAYFEPAIVGFFTFATSIVSMPLRILGTSISQVFYPMAAQEWDEEQQATRAIENAVKFRIPLDQS